MQLSAEYYTPEIRTNTVNYNNVIYFYFILMILNFISNKR